MADTIFNFNIGGSLFFKFSILSTKMRVTNQILQIISVPKWIMKKYVSSVLLFSNYYDLKHIIEVLLENRIVSDEDSSLLKKLKQLLLL